MGGKTRIVMAGGAAPLLAPHVTRAFPGAMLKHNLVLNGLALRVKRGEG